ncbi:isoeugenol synthase 1 [Cryptomeria japonica]|uniref:isoeugenol synthase 1 n=1 Tax=Cryptomeria japonica TaxID=3369 RepID=UPI0027DA59BA|nr:isoeugenol synthase 1 [Cryptomeria japonica]
MNRILIIGATGYIGKYMAKASVSLGYPTFAFVRPSTAAPHSSKSQLLQQFRDDGIVILQGSLDDHNSLVNAIKQVDIVISAVAIPQHLDQLNIIKAIKEAGNIKRFLPSEFGNEVDRIKTLAPFQRINDIRKTIRRATEEAGIPYTFVSANSYAAYFVDYFLHPRQKSPPQEVVIYGDGFTKAVMNLEDDIATLNIMVANDSRTLNKLVIYKPPINVISQSEIVLLWEKKTGRTLKKVYLPEAEMVKLSETLPDPDNIPVSILHSIFVKGDQTNYELTTEDLEVTKLYPEYKFTSIDEFLDICKSNPPEAKLASFV